MKAANKTISRLLLAASLILLMGCENAKKEQFSSEDIERMAEEKAALLIAEDAVRKEETALEVERIAAEKARLNALLEEKRAKIAAEIAEREARRAAVEAEHAEKKALADAQRQSIIENIRDFIDRIYIREFSINGQNSFKFNEQSVKPGMMLTTDGGLHIKYMKFDSPYYHFVYESAEFTVIAQRTANNVCYLEVKSATGESLNAKVSDVPTAPRTSLHPMVIDAGFVILSAEYGAESTWSDVKEFLRSHARNGRINISADSSTLGGDPIFGEVKTLKVKYIYNRRVYERAWQENETVNLP